MKYVVPNIEFGKQTSNSIKGILAIMVLVSHIHGRVDLFDGSIWGTVFSAFGYLAVSGFLFLSGYGLRKVSLTNSRYLADFPQKKIYPFYRICCITILIYIIRDIVCGEEISVFLILQSFLFGKTVVDNGWYLQTQFIFYIIFYFSYRQRGGNGRFWLFILISAYCILCPLLGLSTTWYEAGFCFAAGCVYAECEDRIIKYRNGSTGNKRYIQYMTVAICFFVALFFGNRAVLPNGMRIVVKMLSAILFALLMMSVVSVIKITNGIVRFLGKYSLEIYLLQGIFLNAFIRCIKSITEWGYILAVMISTILAAIVVHPLYSKIGTWGRK